MKSFSKPTSDPDDRSTLERILKEVSTLSALVKQFVEQTPVAPIGASASRISFLEGKQSVLLDDEAIPLTESQRIFLKLMWDCYPDYLGEFEREKRGFGGDASRIIEKMPAKIVELIERKPGAGCRLKTK